MVPASPSNELVTADAAAPVFRILGHARQQLTGARRLDHSNGAVAHCLCQLRIERHQEMQALTGIGIDDAKECRIGHVQIGLIDRDLRCIDRVEACSGRRVRSRSSPCP